MFQLKQKIKKLLPKLKDKNFIKGISTLIGASCLNFLIGAIFSLCTLSVYEISYIKGKGGSIEIEDLTFYYPIEIFFQCVFSFISGFIYKKIGLHVTNLFGVLILSVGYYIMYISSTFSFDILSMILCGVGTGIIYYPSTTNAYEWFKDHNGIIVGIMETMISFGSFFFSFLGEKIINKDEKESNDEDNLYDFEIGKKIKNYLVVLIICLISVLILSFILMFEKKVDNYNVFVPSERNVEIKQQNNNEIDNNNKNINVDINGNNNENIDKNNVENQGNEVNKENEDNLNNKDFKNKRKQDSLNYLIKEDLIEDNPDKKDIEINNDNISNKQDKIENNKNQEIKDRDDKEINIVIENNQNNNMRNEKFIENEFIKEKGSTKDSLNDIKKRVIRKDLYSINNYDKDNERKEKEKELREMLKLAIKSKRLILFTAIVILQSPMANMSFTLYREIGEYKKINTKFLQLIGSSYFIFECLSSFIFGILCDFIKLKYLLFFINIIGTFIGYIYCLTFNNSFIFFFVQNFISFCYGGYYSVKDCFLMKVFGKDIYIELSSYVSLLVAFSVNLLTPATYFILSRLEDKDKAYWILFIFFGSLNFMGLILNFFIKEDPIYLKQIIREKKAEKK